MGIRSQGGARPSQKDAPSAIENTQEIIEKRLLFLLLLMKCLLTLMPHRRMDKMVEQILGSPGIPVRTRRRLTF